MLYSTFDEIEALKGVDSAFSEHDISPLLDENITLFLENNFRLISKKSLLGQSIELAQYNDDLDDYVLLLEALTYHRIDKVFGNQKIIQSDTFRSFDKYGTKHIDSTLFVHTLSAVISDDLLKFLKKRHESLPFFTINTFKFDETFEEDPKSSIQSPKPKKT